MAAPSLYFVYGYPPKNPIVGKKEKIPAYFHSLDAVAELEKLIIGDLEKLYTNAETYAEWRLYRSILNHNVCATAAQRADALGVTWGLWTLEECEK